MITGTSGSSSRSVSFTHRTKIRSNSPSRRGIRESSQVCLTPCLYPRRASTFRNTRFLASIYQGATETAPTTGYKWGFASKTSRADTEAIRAARQEVESSRRRGTASKPRVLGPSLPSQADRVLAEEEAEERRAAELQRKRKRERAEDKDRVEDMVGPKEIGKAGMLEKKRVKRENDKAFREKGDDGFVEADDKTLMGGGDSFRERWASFGPLHLCQSVRDLTTLFFLRYFRIAQRDANRLKWQEKKAGERGERMTEIQERQRAIREKDRATMDAFAKMARERFG